MKRNEAEQVYGSFGTSSYLDIKQPTATTAQNVQVINNIKVQHDLWSWYDGYFPNANEPLQQLLSPNQMLAVPHGWLSVSSLLL